jgi:hypothetical protein
MTSLFVKTHIFVAPIAVHIICRCRVAHHFNPSHESCAGALLGLVHSVCEILDSIFLASWPRKPHAPSRGGSTDRTKWIAALQEFRQSLTLPAVAEHVAIPGASSNIIYFAAATFALWASLGSQAPGPLLGFQNDRVSYNSDCQ